MKPRRVARRRAGIPIDRGVAAVSIGPPTRRGQEGRQGKRLNELGGVAPVSGNSAADFAEVLRRELAVLPKAAQAAGLQLD